MSSCTARSIGVRTWRDRAGCTASYYSWASSVCHRWRTSSHWSITSLHFTNLFHREFQVVRRPVVNLEGVLRAEGPGTKRAHEIFSRQDEHGGHVDACWTWDYVSCRTWYRASHSAGSFIDIAPPQNVHPHLKARSFIQSLAARPTH